MELIVVAVIVGGLVLGYRIVAADRADPDVAWAGPGTGTATGAADAVAAAPAYRTPGPVDPARSALALARIESRRLLASPLLWAGVALTALVGVTVLDSGLPDQSEWLSLGGRLLPLAMYPLCGMVVLAANRATLRPRRDGTVELMAALPAPPSTRTLALVLAQWIPVVVAIVGSAALSVSLWAGATKASGGPLWSRGELDLALRDVGAANAAAAVALVLCAGVLGIGLGRLLPWGLVPIVALVITGVLTGVLGSDDLPAWVGTLSPLAQAPDLPAFLAPLAQWWHVVYLLGLAAVAVGVAFLVDRDRRWAAPTLGLAAVLLAVSIVGQTRSYAGDTPDRIAAVVVDPGAHQSCLERATVRVCAYPELEPIGRAWLAVAGDVRSAAPAAATDGPLVVHQRLSADEIATLDPSVRSLVDVGDAFAWADDPGLHADLRWSAVDGGRHPALLVAHELVGLPEPAGDRVPCYAGGQARAAVAVALAGRAMPVRDHDAFASPSAGGFEPYGGRRYDPAVTDLAIDEWELDADPVVVHTESDLALGRALLALPEDEVRSVLAADWATWVDPATSTAALADAFGLDAAAPAAMPEGLAPCR